MRIVFFATTRANPFVISQKRINILSAQYGRNVEVELRAISESGQGFATFNKLLAHVHETLKSIPQTSVKSPIVHCRDESPAETFDRSR